MSSSANIQQQNSPVNWQLVHSSRHAFHYNRQDNRRENKYSRGDWRRRYFTFSGQTSHQIMWPISQSWAQGFEAFRVSDIGVASVVPTITKDPQTTNTNDEVANAAYVHLAMWQYQRPQAFFTTQWRQCDLWSLNNHRVNLSINIRSSGALPETTYPQHLESNQLSRTPSDTVACLVVPFNYTRLSTT